MANVTRKFGFRPVGQLHGEYTGVIMQAFKPSTDGTTLGLGDVVKHTGTSGTAGTFVNGYPCEGLPIVTRATSGTAGQDYFGVVVGVMPNPTSVLSGNIHSAASTASLIHIVPIFASNLFEVQEDADTTPIDNTMIGSNFAIALGSVDTTSGYGNMLIDSSTVNTTNTLPIRVIKLVQRPDNEIALSTSDLAVYLVQFNTSLWMPNITSV